MSTSMQELIGRQVYSRDDVKIGEIKEVIFGGEYVLLRRSFVSELVVPVRAIERSGERLVIAHSSGYIDHAPQVDLKHELSAKDKARLDEFFALKAA